MWATDRRHATCRFSLQRRFTVKGWAGIVDDYVIDLWNTDLVVGAQCADFLEDTLPFTVVDASAHVREGLWFQHGGAHPHSVRRVPSWSDNIPNSWIGRGGAIGRHPRVPYVTAANFYYL